LEAEDESSKETASSTKALKKAKPDLRDRETPIKIFQLMHALLKKDHPCISLTRRVLVMMEV
jgi:hypothetical protein